jgi:hypothetical protein
MTLTVTPVRCRHVIRLVPKLRFGHALGSEALLRRRECLLAGGRSAEGNKNVIPSGAPAGTWAARSRGTSYFFRASDAAKRVTHCKSMSFLDCAREK